MQRFWWLLVLCFWVNSCGQKLLQAGGSSKSQAASTSSASSGDDTDLPGSDDADATALEPVIVAGAFLACEQAFTGTTSDQSELYCGLNNLENGSKIDLPADVYAAKAYLIADAVQLEIFPERLQVGPWQWRTSLGVNLQSFDLLMIRLASSRNKLWTKFFIAKVAKIPRTSGTKAEASAFSK